MMARPLSLRLLRRRDEKSRLDADARFGCSPLYKVGPFSANSVNVRVWRCATSDEAAALFPLSRVVVAAARVIA